MKRENGPSSAGDVARRIANNNRQQQDHANSTTHEQEGKEKILPLTRRQIHHRLDVYPFILGYVILIWMDVHYSSSSISSSTLSTHHIPLLVDALYIILLVSQLILFLKCQWDPIWHAAIAYRRYQFKPASSLPSESSPLKIMEQKIHGMKCWTHCLVIPPSTYGAKGGNHVSSSSKAGFSSSSSTPSSSFQTVRPERPGIVPVTMEKSSSYDAIKNITTTSFVAVIHFRGWTYRCCCNVSNDKDLPMVSIFQDKKEIDLAHNNDNNMIDSSNDDVDDFDEKDSSIISNYWEPHFHRLHFPIDLPVKFYTNHWNGHSTRHSLQATKKIFGVNQTYIPLPPYSSLLTQQLLQPMFLFQLLCVMLWCLDEYWIYAIYTLISLLMFESVQAFTRWKGVKRLREDVSGADIDDDDHNKRPIPKKLVECYRMGKWTTVPTNQLLVGDIISVISPSLHMKQQQQQRQIVQNRSAHDHEQRGFVIPADLLLLKGRAVVNEAMLTGESVPQVKESLELEEGDEVLDDTRSSAQRLDLSDGSSSAHTRCVLFGGTVLMDHHSSLESEFEQEQQNQSSENTVPNDGEIPPPPNQGLVCFVLRTGFDTIQGQLLRTLAYHAEAGGGGGSSNSGGEGVNAKETFYFLLLLLFCALASASTVVQHAWGDSTRNHFKLMLHVVIIITSVIPPELPMELSLAVTTSLSDLIKRYQIYCTEPFRIPIAGLVDTCCFDKTGTLTSDELRLHGVRLPNTAEVVHDDDITIRMTNESKENRKDDGDLILFDNILSRAKLSHESHRDNDDTNMDSINIIRSLLPHETLRVMVGCQSLATTHVFVQGRDGRTIVQTELCGDPLEVAVMEGCGFTINSKTDTVVEKERPTLVMDTRSPLSSGSVSIKVLHRFAFSSKLRRMTVLAIDAENPNDLKDATLWALTKGAPEALKPMIDPRSLPVDYEQSYLRQMMLGRRVLALAYRNLGKNTTSTLAKWKSSRDNLESKLTFAGLLIMDSPLKADSARVIKELRAGNQNVVMVTGDAVLTAAEVARRVGIIDVPHERTYELCYEENIDSGDHQPFVFRSLNHSVRVEDKADNLLWYSSSNYSKLEAMLRSGAANFCITGDVLTKLANHAVRMETKDPSAVALDDRAVLNHPAASMELSRLAPIISVFARHNPRQKEAVISAFNSSGRHTLMCGDGTNDVGALKRAHVGVSIISVPDLEAKQRLANDVISAVRSEEKRERKSSKKSSSKSGNKRRRAERVERSLRALAEAEDELNFVSLGNASVASPFTSRKTSIRCCKDILQQGRCTLAIMTQIYKILGVQCLVNALVLTTLHQKGVKQGDRQLTAVGLVVAVLFLFVTRGKPLSRLSTRQPPSSVLCKETMISMFLQFIIHFAAIMSVTYMSDVYVDPYDPSIVPDGPFYPNTLNTATFLVTVLSTINTFLVNYRGRPYMESLSENVLLFRSIQACYFILFVCAMEVFPPLNQLMQLSPLPRTGPPTFNLRDDEEGYGNILIIGAVNAVGFRTMLCIIMSLDTMMVTLAEKTVRSVMNC
ncbi:hypothetical protein ACHAWU_000736 [Discostella pseudostelligera]|uniref:P-type ATPase A domain-containing protein n=1 Tax=Discostella pseudostelligera TaxID=259834 RepID=A0ABD3M771_9STRA